MASARQRRLVPTALHSLKLVDYGLHLHVVSTVSVFLRKGQLKQAKRGGILAINLRWYVKVSGELSN